MSNYEKSIFTSSESEILKDLLKNPKDDYQKIVSLFEEKFKKNTKNLRESEEKFRTIAEESMVGISIIQDNIFKFINKKFLDNIGYTYEEIKNWKPNELFDILVHPDQREEVRKLSRKAQSGENMPTIHKELGIIRKNKEIHWLDLYARPIIYQGRPAGMNISIDITDHKLLDQKLEESEEKYRLISENATDLISILNDRYEHEYINEHAYFSTLGYSKEELINKSAWNIVHPEDVERIAQSRKISTDGFQGVEGAYEEELRIRHKDGHYIWIDYTSKVFVDTQGNSKIMVISRDITERKKVEENLRESEEKFRRITEESHLAVIILQDNVIKYANQKLAELSGYSLEEILSWEPGEFLNKAVAPDSVQLVMEQTEKKQRGDPDTLIQYPVHLKKKSGDLYWVDDISKTIMYEGQPADLISLIDITEKINTEQELKESEEKFRTITEQSFIGVIIEQDFMLKYINHQFSTIVGYTSEVLLNWILSDFYEIIHPDDVDRFKKLIDDMTKGTLDNITNFQFRLFKKTGEIIWLELFSRKIMYKNSSANLVFIMDITEKRESEQKIRESEEKFRTIAEQSFMGIFIIQNGKFKYMNQAMSNISGYSIDEMISWTQNEITKVIHKEDLSSIMNLFSNSIESDMIPLKIGSFRLITKEGCIKWIEYFSKMIIYEGKHANLVSFIDITDTKEAELLIIEENKKLIELHELRKDLITRVSHELKTPLTSMYGAFQILLSVYKDEMSNGSLNCIEIGYSGCLRLKQLIDNLLDASRLESKKFELKIQKENLITIIKDCVEEMVNLADNRGQIIDVNLPKEVYLNVDHLRFRQVLTNIISNAINNTQSEGKIQIILIEDINYIDIQVKDTGVGLSKKEKEKLFGKFGKIERYGKDLDVDIEGVGLGLYLSKEIVELHGGQILVESKGRNKGSTFTIRLFKRHFHLKKKGSN